MTVTVFSSYLDKPAPHSSFYFYWDNTRSQQWAYYSLCREKSNVIVHHSFHYFNFYPWKRKTVTHNWIFQSAIRGVLSTLRNTNNVLWDCFISGLSYINININTFAAWCYKRHLNCIAKVVKINNIVFKNLLSELAHFVLYCKTITQCVKTIL